MGRGTSTNINDNLLYGQPNDQRLDDNNLLKEKTLKLIEDGYPEQAKKLFLRIINDQSIESDIFNKQLLKELLPLNQDYAEKQLVGRISKDHKFQSFLYNYLKQSIEEHSELLNQHFTIKPGNFLYKLYSSPENAKIMQALIASFEQQSKNSDSFFNSKLFRNHFNLWKKNDWTINANRALILRAAAESLIITEDQGFFQRLNDLQLKDYSQHIFKSHNRVIHKFNNRDQLRNIHRLAWQASAGKLQTASPDATLQSILDSNMVAVCGVGYNIKSPLPRNQYCDQNSLCRKCFSKNSGYLITDDNQIKYSPEKNCSSFNERQLKFCFRLIADNLEIKEKIIKSDYRDFSKIILGDTRIKQNTRTAQIETVYYRLQSSENIQQVVQRIFNNYSQKHCKQLTDYLNELNPNPGLLPEDKNTRSIYNSFLLALAKITVNNDTLERDLFLVSINQLIEQVKTSGEPLSAETIFN
jgi:hypothetical protein